MASRAAATFWAFVYIILGIFIIFSVFALFGSFSTVTATLFYTVAVILLILSIVHWTGLI